MAARNPAQTKSDDPLAAAVALHQAGDLAGARPLYDKVLRRSPDHPDALHLSGLLLLALGDEDGLRRLRKAVARHPTTPTFRMSLVQALAQRARWEEATAAVEDFIRKLPRDPAAVRCLSALAGALFDAGRPAPAAALYRRAELLQPDDLEPVFNRACCLRDLGRREEAGRAFHAALLREPAHSDGLIQAAALSDAASPWLARALRVTPERADLAAVSAARRLQAKDAPGAWDACRSALVVAPDGASGWINAAPILMNLARPEAAAAAARRSVRSAPGETDAWLNLGMTLQNRDAAAALAAYRRGAALAPALSAAWRNIGSALLRRSAFDAALSASDRGLRTATDDGEAAAIHSNRGVALMSAGRNAAAISAFRAGLALAPHDGEIYSNLLFCLCFSGDTTPEEVFAAHCGFEKILTPPPAPRRLAARPAAADGRLRIGYVSPDFQRYPGPGFHFLLPLLGAHDRRRFSVACYYTDVVHDAATAQFQACADLWRDAGGWRDLQLAEAVAADQIDILVDCDGHMSRNRMAAFARRMAPIQVSFPLYPNTSGLSEMDYQFGDRQLTPPFMQDYRSEALVRLPGSTLCYRPAASAYAPPAQAPWETGGTFTFASFNNLAKLDGPTTAAWSAILRQAPAARLLLKWRGLADGVAERVWALFAAHGVGRERLTLIGNTVDPYEAYGQVDLCLDPLFAAGGTTSCDALWMGVPVLTLPGRTVIGRWGASLLTVVGLGDFIADDPADYVARAVAFAQNPRELSAARRDLRSRVQASPLMDEQTYARRIEQAYSEMQRRLSAGLAPAPFDVEGL